MIHLKYYEILQFNFCCFSSLTFGHYNSWIPSHSSSKLVWSWWSCDGSHRISHLALRQSQSMIPSLHSLLSPVVYPKVPYLAHSFLLSILLLLARWSQKIPSNTICTLMTPSCTSLSLLQILLYLSKHLPTLSLQFFPGWTWTNCSSIHLKLNFFLLAQNNSISSFQILQTYLSAMISSQSSFCSHSTCKFTCLSKLD